MLSPGTVLYADILAFLAFIEWTPEAKQSGVDPVWNGPFPALEPGVYILEASSVPSGLSAPACLLPETTSVAMDSFSSGSGVVDVSLPAGVQVVPDSSAAGGVISLVDSLARVFDGKSQFLVDDSSSTVSVAVVRAPALVIAQAFLTPRNARSKTEDEAIAAARAGYLPPRSSRDAGYVHILKPGGTYRDWLAMTAYLVTELEAFGRAVSDQDLRQLRKWAHKYGAVLRRAAQATSGVSAVDGCPSPRDNTSNAAGRAKKRARSAAEDRVPSVSVRERRGPRFFDPHGRGFCFCRSPCRRVG